MDGLAGTVGCGGLSVDDRQWQGCRELIEIERERVERGGQAWAAGCGQWALARASQDSSALCGGVEVWSGRPVADQRQVARRLEPDGLVAQHTALDGHRQMVADVEAMLVDLSKVEALVYQAAGRTARYESVGGADARDRS